MIRALQFGNHGRTACAASRRKRGLSLLEALVALGILTAGLLGVMAVFPYTMQAERQAEMLSEASLLAQMKAEEIRRDDSRNKALVTEIRSMTQPSEPIAFPNEPRLTYSFSGRSLQYAGNPPGDPRAANGVARVIVRYAPEYRASQDVIYELRFQ